VDQAIQYRIGGAAMLRAFQVAVLVTAGLLLTDRAFAQDSKAAATTRKNLQQKADLDVKKEVGLKDFLTDFLDNLDKPIRFKIDNGSGVSNNSKVSYSGKEVTVEKVLNDLSDKYDFGYYVVSNAANNKEDGKIVIRKSSKGKERGYEAGKEPKDKGASDKKSSLAPAPPPHAAPDLRRVWVEFAAPTDRRFRTERLVP
jgi:hypothetical protein